MPRGSCSPATNRSKVCVQYVYKVKSPFIASLPGMRGGAVASWLVRSTPDRVVQVRGHCVVFLGKTLYSHGASLHPGV